MEDMGQLTERLTEQKYQSSMHALTGPIKKPWEIVPEAIV